MKKPPGEGGWWGLERTTKSPRRKTGRAMADAMIASLSEN